MPVQLLPASAAAFAPRASSVNVVLGSKVEPWLTQTLKRINKIKRPLNSVPQHQRCLTETLSSPNAIWTLTSLMLPKAPDSELRRDPNPLVEALFNYQLLHVEAYIVHVDMVLRNEVAFKLTVDSIESLVEYHRDIHCVDAKAGTAYDWAEKDAQCKKLHEDFVQAINKFVFRTHVSALEGLEEDGAGELLCGKSDEVKTNILGLMKPLLPPPPRIEVRQPAALLPSSPAAAAALWAHQHAHIHQQQHQQHQQHQHQQSHHQHQHQQHHIHQHPTPPGSLPDPWKVLPSSPSVTSTSADSSTATTIWALIGNTEVQLPSPTPSFSQPYSSAGFFYSSPQVTAPIPALQLPSMLSPQCGVSVGMGGFGWDRYQEYTPTM